MNQSFYGKPACVAAMSSMTLAFKAEKTLAAIGIPCEIISLLPGVSRHGCAYGLLFPCETERQVRSVLRGARIPVSQYLKRGTSL